MTREARFSTFRFQSLDTRAELPHVALTAKLLKAGRRGRVEVGKQLRRLYETFDYTHSHFTYAGRDVAAPGGAGATDVRCEDEYPLRIQLQRQDLSRGRILSGPTARSHAHVARLTRTYDRPVLHHWCRHPVRSRCHQAEVL